MLFASGKDTESDEIERMRYLAIERHFELIGECLNRALTTEPQFARYLPDAHSVISMRNRIAHEYDSIDVEVIWETAEQKVPVFIETVRSVIESEDQSPS